MDLLFLSLKGVNSLKKLNPYIQAAEYLGYTVHLIIDKIPDYFITDIIKQVDFKNKNCALEYAKTISNLKGCFTTCESLLPYTGIVNDFFQLRGLSEKQANILSDKWNWFLFVKEHGFPHTRHYQFKNEKDLLSIPDIPFFVKTTKGSGGTFQRSFSTMQEFLDDTEYRDFVLSCNNNSDHFREAGREPYVFGKFIISEKANFNYTTGTEGLVNNGKYFLYGEDYSEIHNTGELFKMCFPMHTPFGSVFSSIMQNIVNLLDIKYCSFATEFFSMPNNKWMILDINPRPLGLLTFEAHYNRNDNWFTETINSITKGIFNPSLGNIDLITSYETPQLTPGIIDKIEMPEIDNFSCRDYYNDLKPGGTIPKIQHIGSFKPFFVITGKNLKDIEFIRTKVYKDIKIQYKEDSS